MKFAIVGLGHFGRNLAVALARSGAEVMAFDRVEEAVNLVKDEVSFAATLNAADPQAVGALPLDEMDAVIVAIGDDFESSLLTVANLQELKVRRLIARVINPVHGRILRLMRITETLMPEQVAASTLAHTLLFEGVLSSYRVSEGFEIVEVTVPARLVGRSLLQANLRAKYQLNLITVKRPGALPPEVPGQPYRDQVLGVLDPEYRFREGDVIVVFGGDVAIRAFLEKG